MGTGSFPGVKRPGCGVDHPPSSRAEVKEILQVYLYSPYGPSWPVLGWPLPLPITLEMDNRPVTSHSSTDSLTTPYVQSNNKQCSYTTHTHTNVTADRPYVWGVQNCEYSFLSVHLLQNCSIKHGTARYLSRKAKSAINIYDQTLTYTWNRDRQIRSNDNNTQCSSTV